MSKLIKKTKKTFWAKTILIHTDCSVDDVNVYVFHSVDHENATVVVCDEHLMQRYEQAHELLTLHTMHVTFDQMQLLRIASIDVILKQQTHSHFQN